MHSPLLSSLCSVCDTHTLYRKGVSAIVITHWHMRTRMQWEKPFRARDVCPGHCTDWEVVGICTSFTATAKFPCSSTQICRRLCRRIFHTCKFSYSSWIKRLNKKTVPKKPIEQWKNCSVFNYNSSFKVFSGDNTQSKDTNWVVLIVENISIVYSNVSEGRFLFRSAMPSCGKLQW